MTHKRYRQLVGEIVAVDSLIQQAKTAEERERLLRKRHDISRRMMELKDAPADKPADKKNRPPAQASDFDSDFDFDTLRDAWIDTVDKLRKPKRD